MEIDYISLTFDKRRGIIFNSDGRIELDGLTVFTIDELDAILTEAKAFREYRNSRMPIEEPEEVVNSHRGKFLVFTKEMLIDSLHKEDSDQTLVTKVDKGNNNINEVIDINKDTDNKSQVLQEVPVFTDNTTDCTYHKCNNSQYWITTDGRIKIDPPEPYNMYIYTTVAEIQRLRSMTAAELTVVLKAYGKQTYPNKRYALRAFLRNIADDVFPPAVQPVADAEPTITPDPADKQIDTPEPNAEYPEPELTPVPTDLYVLKTRMSKKTAALWEKFAKPSEITNDDNIGAHLS